MQLGAMHNIYYSYFGQSTRMVDSGIFIDKICWFYPNRESTFWTMHAILKLQVPILAMRNNKMGHRINKMWTLINKVGHRNVKLVDTYQQVGFKKQQNGSRVLYQRSCSCLLGCTGVEYHHQVRAAFLQQQICGGGQLWNRGEHMHRHKLSNMQGLYN